MTEALHPDVSRILISAARIQARVAELGRQISLDYAGRRLLMLSVLKGSVVFMADLMRAVTVPVAIDFMAVSSYGNKSVSGGVVKIVKDIDIELAGYDVLIVEDILDSGRTLSYLRELLGGRGPASMRVAALLDKPTRREADIQPDYCGFVVPDEFVVGYGLDYAERYRNIPDIGVLKPEVYTAR